MEDLPISFLCNSALKTKNFKMCSLYEYLIKNIKFKECVLKVNELLSAERIFDWLLRTRLCSIDADQKVI